MLWACGLSQLVSPDPEHQPSHEHSRSTTANILQPQCQVSPQMQRAMLLVCCLARQLGSIACLFRLLQQFLWGNFSPSYQAPCLVRTIMASIPHARLNPLSQVAPRTPCQDPAPLTLPARQRILPVPRALHCPTPPASTLVYCFSSFYTRLLRMIQSSTGICAGKEGTHLPPIPAVLGR